MPSTIRALTPILIAFAGLAFATVAVIQDKPDVATGIATAALTAAAGLAQPGRDE